jgi:hypothetical protein
MATRWLPSNLISNPAGMGYPPSKFLISFYRFYVLEIVHLNPNVIFALSSFVILRACWLGIEPNLDLFRYFYSRATYSTKEVVHTARFSLRSHRMAQYIPAKLRDLGKVLGRSGSSLMWGTP